MVNEYKNLTQIDLLRRITYLEKKNAYDRTELEQLLVQVARVSRAAAHFNLTEKVQ